MASTKGADARPIIIRKVKKGGHAHHGGAWKVAYADFVTAMMAFFLLMWLLASVEAGDRAQIANYFQRPLSSIVATGGRPGGDRIIAQSQSGSTEEGVLLQGSEDPHELSAAALEAAQLEALREEFEGLTETNPLFSEFADQLRVDLTEQGLRVQLIDRQQRPMFAVGSAALQPYTREILAEIARSLNDVPNRVSVSGHTDATPYPSGESGYSNWELSADRANAARRILVGAGVNEGTVARVEGLASSELLNADDPFDPANRRISILILKRSAEGGGGAEDEADVRPPAPDGRR